MINYENQANTVIKMLEKRNMAGYFVQTKEEAREKVFELIGKTDSIGMGGTETMKEIGVLEQLQKGEYNFLDRSKANSREEADDIMRQCLLTDTFLMSTNAITMDGKLINIDGNANRVAALCFGPKQVIIVAGMNKVAADEETAYKRVKTSACPPNAQRLNLSTPCALTGKCANCLNGTICCQEVVTRYSRDKGRIKVILVGEAVGY